MYSHVVFLLNVSVDGQHDSRRRRGLLCGCNQCICWPYLTVPSSLILSAKLVVLNIITKSFGFVSLAVLNITAVAPNISKDILQYLRMQLNVLDFMKTTQRKHR